MKKKHEKDNVSRDELLLHAAGELTGERAEAVRRAVEDSRLLSREVERIQALLDAPARLAIPRPRLATLVGLQEAARRGRRRRLPLLERLGGVLVARRTIAVAATLALLFAAALFFQAPKTGTPSATPVPVVDYGEMEIDAGLYELRMNLAAVGRLPSVEAVDEPDDLWTAAPSELDLRIEDLREALDDLAEEMETV